MKTNGYNEFDNAFRSMLENAEESVPSHIMDDVFARLDAAESAVSSEKKRKVLPFRVRYAMTGIAAAAVISLCVILWPKEETPESMTTAEVVVSEQNRETLKQDMLAENVAEKQETPTKKVAERPVRKAEPAVTHEVTAENPETAYDISDDDGIQTNISEDRHEEIVNVTTDSPKESEPSDDEYVGDPFSNIDEETGRQAAKVSFLMGGDVASNGDAKSMNRFGGHKAPILPFGSTKYIEQTSKNSSYAIPVTFGATVKISFGNNWAIGTGLNYTMLQRTFAGKYTEYLDGVLKHDIESDIRHTTHYIGIPVNAYYTFLRGQSIKLYAYAGGTAEKAVSNKFKVLDGPERISYSEKAKGVQFSAGAGLGVEFNVIDRLGIYVNPGVRYFFDCDQPVSIRTQQPFMMDFEIGLRVNI